ncbi:putative precorrin-6x reductase [Mycobacterium xenopi 3993]|nr:putative precorrin-6x reductase [Mycobacterium xenopi 3993]
MMRVLLLGGTAEARALAARLHPDVDLISSLAGGCPTPHCPSGRCGSAGSVVSKGCAAGCATSGSTLSSTPRIPSPPPSRRMPLAHVGNWVAASGPRPPRVGGRQRHRGHVGY